MKIAVIGMGVMGRNHYRVLSGLENVEVAALMDPFIDNTYGDLLYRELDVMLEQVELDAAIIAVPTFLHKEVALKCIEKGLDIFIEKPVAPTAQEGYDIAEAAEKAGVKTAVGYIERFNPVVGALKNELKGKEIYSISMTRVGPFPPRIADVGILTDLAVHDIDLIRFISGREIKRVEIVKSKKIHNHHEDNAVLSFELEGEVIANIVTSWLTPFKKRQMEVACQEGYFEADLMGQDLTEYGHFQATNTFNSYAVQKRIVKKEEPLVRELEAFLSYLKTGERGDLATIEDSIKTIDISKGDVTE